SGVLRSRITDDKRHELEGWQDGLQEPQFHLQSVLRLVRSVGLGDKFETAYLAARFSVDKHTTEGSFEGLDSGGSNPSQLNGMCGPDQHHARDRLCVCPELRKCCGGHAARIDVACVRRDQRLGHNL